MDEQSSEMDEQFNEMDEQSYGLEDLADSNHFIFINENKEMSETLQTKFTCDCGRSYAHKRSLWRHKMELFGCKQRQIELLTDLFPEVLDDDAKPYACVCGRRYRRSRTLWRHQKFECRNSRQFQCSRCLKFFNRKEHTMRHYNVCIKDQPDETIVKKENE